MQEYSAIPPTQRVQDTTSVGDLALLPLLLEHNFTRGLSEARLAQLALLATEVTFRENQVILEDGRRSDYFYLLVDGSVAIELRSAAFSVCVQAIGPGSVFGWSALLEHQDTLFGVRARESTRALRLDGAALAALCNDDPQLGTEILRRTLRVVAGRVRATELRFAEMCGIKVAAAPAPTV